MSEKNISFHECTIQMPLMALPVRSSLVTIGENKIFLAPGSALSEMDYRNITGVTDIVATSLLHAAGVPLALRHFPQARVWAAPGLRKSKPGIPWTHDLNKLAWFYQEALPMVLLRGIPKVNEVVFFHRDSGSLLVSDLFFSLREASGWGAWAILKMFGTYRRFGMSRFFARFVKDRPEFENSLREILSYPFSQIVPCHGEIERRTPAVAFRQAAMERGFLLVEN